MGRHIDNCYYLCYHFYMTKKDKLLEKAQNNPKNITFDEVCALASMVGFVFKKSTGSHKIYHQPGVLELLNFQNDNGKAKPYQVRQLLKIIEIYGLKVK